ncbi:unnamed protein product [Prorocentrum cordatum]|uniref:Uncharacterized protein n=1 Tax=Prorocentrum cordatum TaxID=2364126 RepID=A0ABN9SLD1_9DINO|nr:unnamed protein product [Polarella glacialis]
MDMLCSEGPSSLSHQVPSDARQPPPPPGRSLPQFGDAARPSARDALDDFPAPAVAPLERPLYDWPFEPAGPADAAAGGSTPRRHLEAAAPTRQKLLEGSPKGIVANGAEFQALGEAGCSWTPRGSAARMRTPSTPPLLPPVHTPRG